MFSKHPHGARATRAYFRGDARHPLPRGPLTDDPKLFQNRCSVQSSVTASKIRRQIAGNAAGLQGGRVDGLFGTSGGAPTALQSAPTVFDASTTSTFPGLPVRWLEFVCGFLRGLTEDTHQMPDVVQFETPPQNKRGWPNIARMLVSACMVLHHKKGFVDQPGAVVAGVGPLRPNLEVLTSIVSI